MPSVTPDQIDPRLQGAEIHLCSKNGTELTAEGESYAFTINPALSPPSDQIFARIALSRMEFYNTIYNITTDFTAFEYTIVDILTHVSSTHTLTLTPGQYSTTDIAAVFTAGLDSRLIFIYDSNTFLFTMAVVDSTTYNFYLSSATATWAEEFLHFDATTVESEIAGCTSLNVVTMAPTENVYVTIDAFPCTSIRLAKEVYPNILARVPVIAAPGDKNTYTPYDPFFVEVRNPNISSFNISLLDDTMTLLELNGSPWSLTLYVDYVFFEQVDRPGDVLNTAYTRNNPLAQEGLYRRSDV
jgi:hypothetical protein